MQHLRSFLLILLLLPVFTAAQNILISGVVKDKSTKKPLAFVHILSSSGRGTTTDIDGKFKLYVKKKDCCLKLTYVGYEILNHTIDDKREKQKIFLTEKRYDLDEVEIFPGVNPAHRIIDSVFANRHRNDPKKLDAFKYVSYDKMVITLDLDSLKGKDKTKDIVQLDTIPIDTALIDTSGIDIKKLLEKQDIFLMETVTERMYKSPGLNQETVLATKVSGFRDPMMAFMISQIQSTSFYDELISIVNRKYINPISRGSTKKYFFLIEDTTYTDTRDTVFIISFRPLKKTKFEGMTGFLSINSNRWAIQNVKAQPANDTTGIIVKIEQLYEFIQDQWFPSQLHTDVIFSNFQVPAGDEVYHLVGNGRSYIREIDLSPDIKKREFGYSEVEIESDASKKTGEFWREYRIDSLTDREKETYRVIDSLGKEANFDRLAGILQTLMTGRIPLGPIDIDIDKLIHYNDFEGLYLGVGLHTNDRVSKVVKFGGFFGYGFRDKNTKYGLDFSAMLHKRSQSKIRLEFYNKTIASGDVTFGTDQNKIWQPDNFYRFFVSQMNMTFGGELHYSFKVRPMRDFKWDVGFRLQEKKTFGNYYFTPNGDINNPQTVFNFSDLMLGFRFAFRERTIQTTKGQFSFGSDYPVVWFNYTHGFDGFLNGEYSYDRFDIKIDDAVYIKYLGEFSYRIMGGFILGELPINNNYNAPGTYRMFTLYAPNSFGTMATNEFYSDTYASAFLSHNFKNLLVDFKKWHPELVLITNIAFGTMSHTSDHHNIDFNTLEKGYYESGIVIRKMLDLRFYDLGIGVLYRYGPYTHDNVSLNFGYKITLFYGFN